MKTKHFHTCLRKEALQTFGNINATNKKVKDALGVFRRKSVEPESQAKTKHKWLKHRFDPNTRSLSDFLEELNGCAQRVFGDNARHRMKGLLYAKSSPDLKQSINLAYQNGAFDKTVAHIENQIENSSLENDGELSRPTRTAALLNNNSQKIEQSNIV